MAFQAEDTSVSVTWWSKILPLGKIKILLLFLSLGGESTLLAIESTFHVMKVNEISIDFLKQQVLLSSDSLKVFCRLSIG